MFEDKLVLDLPFEEYLATQAINSGAINAMMNSPSQGRAYLEGKFSREETPYMRLGKMLHMFLLEPEQAFRSVVVSTPCSAVLGSGANKGNLCAKSSSYTDGKDWFCGMHKSASPSAVLATNFLTPQEYDDVHGMIESLRGTTAEEILSRPSHTEVSLFFRDETGLPMKGRVDWLSEDRKMLFDIKKVQRGTASLAACQVKIANYGYHRQLAMYVTGVEALTGVTPTTVGWIFIEDSYPYDSNVVVALPQDIEIGKQEIRECLDRHAKCSATGEFPGYNKRGEVSLGGLPEYYKRRFIAERSSDDGRITSGGSRTDAAADNGIGESRAGDDTNEWTAWLANSVDCGPGAGV